MTAVQVDAQGMFLRFSTVPDGDTVVSKNEEGYVICVPFPDGFRKFVTDGKAFRFDVDTYLTMDNPKASECVHLWDENFTDAEIDELTKPRPAETSELDLLKQRLVEAETENKRLAGESNANQLALMELHMLVLSVMSPDEG
ncbi:hypothetical protein [Paenibacillus amylolyticus]|uniref:hypothetical protein n=1 Tax=Paenibacillus amylolyticus TaxID=1451 RepID=UPI000B8A560C|nr:hypothetical protein [Paenibacillus amylolyticus]